MGTFSRSHGPAGSFYLSNLCSQGTNIQGQQPQVSSVLCQEGGNREPSAATLRDCLVKHTLRANYQGLIWRRCLEQDAQISNPVGKGWTVDSGQLVVHWMDGEPAPQAILDLLACNCTRTCQLPSCECMVSAPTCLSYPTVEIKPQSQLMMEVKMKMMMSMSRKMKRIINSRHCIECISIYYL